MSTVATPPHLSARINRIEVSATLAITAEALKLKQHGVDLADFGAGEPHFPTPEHIKCAAITAIEKNFTRYTNVAGIPEVRKAIVDRHAADFGSNYTADECVFTTGGKLGIFNAVEVLVDAGDEVIIPTPYWVSYKDIVQFAGGVPVFVQTSEAENFRVTAAMVEAAITPRTRCILLNSPSNPSGAVMSRADVEAIVRLAARRGIYVLLDECYIYLDFTGSCFSGASLTECKDWILVLGSFSKTYAMTGWRAGYVLAPRPIAAAIAKLQSQSTSNAASMVQHACLAAVSGSQECVAEMRADYLRLRDRILAGLRSIPGITCTTPQGAFYVYPNVSGLFGRDGLRSAEDVAARLLSEAHLVSVPGEPFGTTEHIRLSYAVSAEVIDKGIERLAAWCSRLTPVG